MSHCKGKITRIRQHSGCVEVTVEGVVPGSFPVDNGCFAMLHNPDIPLIGRQIEYFDGHMRFLDECDEAPPARIPFLQPSRSPQHI